MSDMRRAARSLVEERSERFESRHDAATSRERLARALDRAGVSTGPTFEAVWVDVPGTVPTLEARFHPSRRTQRLLQGLSICMVVLVAASIWIVMRPAETAARFLLPLFTVLSILALPFVTLALASQRDAEESRIRRAIRIALRDEDEAFPAQQKWDDED